MQFDDLEAYQTHFKEQIAAACDKSYLKALKDDLQGFTHITAGDMIDHLREQCLAMTSKEKKQKLKQIDLAWDHGDDIRVFQ